MTLDAWLAQALIPLLILYLLFGLDDAIFDFYAWFTGSHAGRTKPLALRALRRKKQKRIAIVVAAWNESEVIARMVRGNTEQIDYRNYEFFVGVYPNDEPSIAALASLGAEHPHLNVVINTRPGPTSKGQMLNEIVRRIGSDFDALLVHDSEDIIHPYACLAVNASLDKYDFVQVPVFSLAVKQHQWVAGIYMDEFAEFHTKDVRARNRLSGSFPAAGVGMGISRALVDKLVDRTGGLFNETSLTEDYELGLTTAEVGARSVFLCAHYRDEKGDKAFLATREYFPKRVRRSIRQKTRWTVGISFQGWERLGWRGNFWRRYFLFRDRKGPWGNMAVFAGMSIWIRSADADSEELDRLAARCAFVLVASPEFDPELARTVDAVVAVTEGASVPSWPGVRLIGTIPR